MSDPTTGKSVTRLNPETEWIRNEVPALRIIDDALWQAVKRQQQALAERHVGIKAAAQARALQNARRPAYLLSSLLECGTCGGTYAIVVGDRYGCAGHHRSGNCSNNRTIRRDDIERRALAGITERLVSADKIDAAVAAYAAHIHRENREQRLAADADRRGNCSNNRTIRRDDIERRALAGITERLVSADKIDAAVAAYAAHIHRENREQRLAADADRRGLARIDKALSGIMAGIEDGMYQPTMKARMAELERERAEITVRLAEAPQDIPDIHPGIAEIYKRKVARLTESLEDPDTRLDASSDIRSLVGKIVLHPGEKRGEVHATLHGSLIGILDFASDTQQPAERRVITSVCPGSR